MNATKRYCRPVHIGVILTEVVMPLLKRKFELEAELDHALSCDLPTEHITRELGEIREALYYDGLD